jgi:alkenylglycerophosphocholine/alkenylglycerophosphoethanolamine hydrolase
MNAMNIKIGYVLFASVYILLRTMNIEGIFPVIIKVIPILLLLNCACKISSHHRTDKAFLMLALFFSLVGDAILSLKATWFVFGLGAFLIAHLFYIPLFVRHFKFQKSKIALPVGVIIYAATMGWILKDINPKLLIPVYGYLAIISVMVITSVFNNFNNKILIFATLLFMISDSLIAVNKFLTPIPLSGLLIMSTYYIAQFIITNTMVSELEKNSLKFS